MGLHVECGFAGGGAFDGMHLPIERGALEWSQTLTAGATSAGEARDYSVFTVTADEDGWLAIGATPDATTNPRRRIMAGQQRSFNVRAGDKIAWATA